ncbi:unnamed protein product [Mycena citricolor]|uniref:Uncharacterized protein n=1 Tax=Mycena citricolor TaxID=2018698 RepID=A0AAD2Q2D2_9AGAR|nr:unnamed protein product [Mycena citricolor]
MFAFATSALLLAAAGSAQASLAPKKFLPIPLGGIRATGWLQDQLMVQTNGLAGHEHEFYHYVSQTDWMGGNSYYSSLEEAGSYWFNAMVPNGFLANHDVINARTSAFLSYVLDTQDASGWLGPEVNTNKPRYLWGRYPFFFGAIQMTEIHPELTAPVVDALYNFTSLANTMLHSGNNTGVEIWTATRWEDFVMVLQWLYDYHPKDAASQALLIDTMAQLKYTGVPWEKVFLPEWHGVNMAEGLKALPATYRFTKNQSDLDVASKGWDLLFQYHGRPSGIFNADEYLAGLEAIRGTELCVVVETMFSGSYLYQVIGDPKFIDRVERIAYNALPATLTGDMWNRQYLQQQNQIFAGNMSQNPFAVDGPYSNVFGLEPNYPCCTVNHPQGWPKFITNSFATTPDMKSLVHTYLGPFSTSITLAPSNPVTVNVDTMYPFSDTLTTTITAKSPFTYYVRIPSWVVKGTIAVDGGKPAAVSPKQGLHALKVKAGTTKFVLNLPAPITIESRPHGSVAVHRGPLNYAFDIPRRTTILANNTAQAKAQDFEFDATAAWQYAIDPSSLKFVSKPPASGVLPSPIFDSGLTPLSITATACLVDWAIEGPTFAASPPTNPSCVGNKTTITLTPYGSTKLRISEFPVFV